MKQSYKKQKEGDQCHSELSKDIIRGEYNNTPNKEDKIFIMKHGAGSRIKWLTCTWICFVCTVFHFFFKSVCFRFFSINWVLGCWVVSCWFAHKYLMSLKIHATEIYYKHCSHRDMYVGKSALHLCPSRILKILYICENDARPHFSKDLHT